MKYLITGDWHITDKRPENRVDDYWVSLIKKLRFILSEANDYGVQAILQPGDFTDSPSLSYEAFSDLTDELKFIVNPIITIWGQHDLRFRNKSNTALRALSKALGFTLLSQVESPKMRDKDVVIHGCSYDEEIPIPEQGKFNILLIHKMIVEDKLWSQQEGHEWANAFIRRNKFDVIVSGDNHQFFTASSGNRYLFNCGSLMRSTIAQIEHDPKIIIMDTDTREYNVIDIPKVPYKKVFQVETILKEKERSKELDAFIKGLSEQKEMSLDFDEALNDYMKINNIDGSIRSIIEECKHG